MKKLYRFTQVLVLILIGLAPTMSSKAQSDSAIDSAGGPQDRIDVVLTADPAPAPTEITSLTFQATPHLAAPDLEITWLVPDGVELLGDATEQVGSITARQTITSQRQIRFPGEGTYKIVASAVYHPAPGVQFAAAGVLFYQIDAHGSRVSDRDPDAQSAMGSKLEAEITTSSHLTGPTSVEGEACFTVNGNIQRIDRPPTTSGYGSDVIVPVHNAIIEVWEEDDASFDDSYGTTLTDSNGNFSKSFCDGDGAFGGDTLEIYIELRSELVSNGHSVVEVEDSSYIDEVYEFPSWVIDSEGGTVTFNVLLNENQSAIFNIADAVFDAWSFWNESGGESGAGGDSIFDETAEVHWEAGYGDDKSYYMDHLGEMTIADDPSDPDQWDESVIMHEWGHMADDEYSCDDASTGQHSATAILDDPELSWGEGYPDYYQSAVRAAKGYPNGNFYLDIRPGNSGIINLETWDVAQPMLISTLNEIAIAAALWDINDNVVDGQDRVSHGHAAIQEVYTSDNFDNIAYGHIDDDCTFDTYMRAWVAEDQPADGPTAAVVMQNTGYTLSPATLVTNSPSGSGNTPGNGEVSDSIWWNQVSYVVDNSASMSGSKFNAVKTVLHETINDLGELPEGTEFNLLTFNNTSLANETAFAGQFFPEDLTTAVNTLTTNPAADNNCQVNSLVALTQAILDQTKGDAWLFTDGDTSQVPYVDTVIHLLNTHKVRASVGLMGVCALAQANNIQGAINLKGTDISNYIQTVPEAEAREALEAHMQQVTVNGMAQEYMGLAGGEVPGGIVPYLLTALNSGGQFLYVDENNIANAADILRAQITNSAGAGRWSDYVSDSATYRHDRLTSWEYNWIDARNGGTNHGYHSDEGYISVNLPASFTYYELGPYNGVRVYENGYMTFGSYSGIQSTNTMLPNPAVPNNVVYPFWDNLVRHFHPANQPQTPTHENGYIYSKQEGDWFAVEYFHYDSSPTASNTFETLLNASTGEIRFQYETVPEGANSATIGLENAGGSRGVQVSYNEAPGANDGMGYKFVPAPPQPTKTYTVAVDAHMEAIGFLLAGYSGSFEPLAVYDPDDNLVSCNEAGALCLELDLVQYMQVNVNGRIGEWHVVVDAGPTGEGTFNFTSMAASPIAVASSGNHFLSTGGGTSLFVNLGLPVDGNMLSGWFTQPNDTPCGTSFNLYDDGEHEDGLAGDGLFGSNPYTMNTACTAYLWVGGTLNGEDFERIDPVPYSFQPLSISSSSDGANFGGGTPLQFELHNADVHDHCYWLLYTAPEGWWLEGLSILPLACVNAGQTNILNVTAYMGPGNTNDLPSGTSGEFALSMVEIEEGIMSDVTAVGVTRYRPTDYIEIFNPNRYIRPNGDTALMTIYVFDEQNVSVADGTVVQLGATLGTISPITGTTQDGVVLAEFTSGAAEGTAVITAMSNGITAETTIDILQPLPNQIELSAAADHLPSDGTATTILVATVRDRWGDPVANQMVRIGVEGDGNMGMIGNGEVVEGMTDGNGRLSATFVAGVTPGDAWVRAELLISDGNDYHVVHDDRQRIVLGNRIFIPFVMR